MPQYSTIQHDAIHKFIFNPIDRYKVIQYLSQKKGFNFDRDNFSSTIDIERPIFSNNGARRFICDGIIDITSISDCSYPKTQVVNGNGLIVVTIKSFGGKEMKHVELYKPFDSYETIEPAPRRKIHRYRRRSTTHP